MSKGFQSLYSMLKEGFFDRSMQHRIANMGEQDKASLWSGQGVDAGPLAKGYTTGRQVLSNQASVKNSALLVAIMKIGSDFHWTRTPL